MCSYSPRGEKQQGKTCKPLRKLWGWLIFRQREDFSRTFTDSSSCSILSKASLLSSRRVTVKLQLLKKTQLKTSPCKYTFLTDSNASLWLFSSVNHETFLEIFLAKINNIFPASNRLLTKVLQKVFSETFKHTYNYQEKMAQVFNCKVLIGRFQEHTLN